MAGGDRTHTLEVEVVVLVQLKEAPMALEAASECSFDLFVAYVCCSSQVCQQSASPPSRDLHI